MSFHSRYLRSSIDHISADFTPRSNSMSSLVEYPVALPRGPIPLDTDIIAAFKPFERHLSTLSSDYLATNAIWRDIFSMTGTARTFYGQTISAAWKETTRITKPGSFRLDEKSVKAVRIGEISYIHAAFSFDTSSSPQTECTALLALVPDTDGGWRIWTLRTILDQLKFQGNVDVLEPSNINYRGKLNGYVNGEARLMNARTGETHFDCAVIGGGQAGLSVAGRLQALDVNYIVLDKKEEVGGSWKSRYNSARRKCDSY